MTLTELRYIVTLAREQHFGRAAERCFVSQPTLSVGVKKLESELGIAIFERTKSSVKVTPLGEQVVKQAQKVLEEASAVKAISSAGKDQLSTTLRVGAIYTIGPYLFPHLVPQLRQMAPSMPLYIEENFTAVLRQKLRNGELDAIIIALPFTEPDVLTKPLYDEPFTVLMPHQHPLHEQAAVARKQLCENELLLLGEGHCFRDQVLEACPGLGSGDARDSKLRTDVEGGSLETLRHMVASGMGITVLPMSAAGDRYYAPDMLATRPFEAPIPFRTVAIAWRASFPRPKAIDMLADAIRHCSIADKPAA
ncbi:LysR substrate-binding domain-containing protein [Aestuariirhabdus sp. Z084]|uniref:hydrogen peroxide-inducible genes activator n=1 Tax=Aestuariirhabdus haliotis TaxID=2918751 RepID=UPI00201B3FDE|nr:hydrogen peroxide-inducible genes activator [Aestuariirhabdus haliotis]MCL6414311.1 LysR substrate-binding domain-containing protein [Aestuariirhabdus haliotis]MCL6418243.1 LysR substrate-binding domain-containing protein [Aestuariirhabdus haliotis]